MFGQQDNSGQQDAPIPDQTIDGVIQDVSQGDPGAGQGAHPPSDSTWQHPGTPLTDDQTDNSAPVIQMPPTPMSTPPSAPDPAPVSSTDNVPSDLADIKQQALGQLSPLVGHLDQSPEDKFRTLMMMIQASDDQSKIPDAYAAAQAIPDEKTRAQALLDVINEINYFSQHHSDLQ
ncbi:MAG TPA: hypothetical protein VHB51_00600 [Candidatus Saccharimonadales bacterium]|nr:hypothetical protein [Candidatus Saccharimonadales bacterium]